MNLASLPLTLRQLQYVVAVAETRHFGRAAQLCHVSQPSLSAQIAELEGALGVRLFERSRRGVLLSPAGAALVPRARQVLLQVQDLVDASMLHVDPLAGRLKFGVIPTMGPYLLPEIDPALRAAFPKLSLWWIEDKTEVLVQRIQQGELDGAFLALEAELDDLEQVELGRDPFVLALPRSHPLARGRAPIPLRRLQGAQVLLLDEGHCLREQALELCTTAGTEELSFRATSLATLTQMVAAGNGVTLLPRMSLEVENRRGLLAIRPFAAPVPYRTLGMVWRRGYANGEALAQLASKAREVARRTLPLMADQRR